MSTIVFRLPLSPGSAALGYAFAYSEDGIHIRNDGQAGLADLPPAKQWMGLIPCGEISWHRIDLPKVAAKKIRPALEGLLEETLLDDIEELHFALAPGAKPGDTGVWVAACNKEWLQAALAPLAQVYGAGPIKLVPEIAPTEDRYALVCSHEREQAGEGNSARDMVWIASSEAVFPYPLEQAQALLHEKGIPIYAEPQDIEKAERALGQSVMPLTKGESLARALHQAWNLAQFDFDPSGNVFGKGASARLKTLWQHLWHDERWRVLKWGLIGLVGVNVLGMNVYAWKLEAEVKRKKNLIEQTAKNAFPQLTVVLDAPSQMQAELSRLQLSRGVRSEQSLTAQLAKMQATQAGVTLDRLRYENGALLESPGNAPALSQANQAQTNVSPAPPPIPVTPADSVPMGYSEE